MLYGLGVATEPFGVPQDWGYVGLLVMGGGFRVVLRTPRPKATLNRIEVTITGCLGLLLMVVAGVGVIHKAGLEWGGWLYAKIGCWLFVGVLPVLVRKGTVPRFFGLLLAVAVGGAATWLAITKPF